MTPFLISPGFFFFQTPLSGQVFDMELFFTGVAPSIITTIVCEQLIVPNSPGWANTSACLRSTSLFIERSRESASVSVADKMVLI